MKVLKTDSQLQIVWGEVYAPNDLPDSQGDRMNAEEILGMSYRFMKNHGKIDTDHTREEANAYVVESFIVRKNDPEFPIPGAWVIGVHVPDVELWNKILNNEYNGFSIDGEGFGVTKEVEVYIPDELTGETSTDEDHSHKFTVYFDDEGKFTGGYTDEVNGHSHQILRGTVTQKVSGHRHTFSFVEGLVNVVQE